MKNPDKTGFLLFWSAAIIHISSIYTNSPLVGYFSKPLLMIFLGLAFYQYVLNFKNTWLVYLALFFSFLGDIFLMIPGSQPVFFLLGVLAFMLAQISYTLVCLKYRRPGVLTIKDQLWKGLLIIVPMAYMIVFWLMLRPGLGEMLFPVTVYSIAILSMVVAATLRYKYASKTSFWMVLAGAAIFIASDSMIAVNKFLIPITGERYLVMTTYIVAQYLIIRGLIHHIKAS